MLYQDEEGNEMIERERIIINYYFGFHNHNRMKQSKIANILSIDF